MLSLLKQIKIPDTKKASESDDSFAWLHFAFVFFKCVKDIQGRAQVSVRKSKILRNHQHLLNFACLSLPVMCRTRDI